jgi:head-tail adaptor
MIGAHLIHRCTIERAARHTDAYGADVSQWSVLATNVACRFVAKAERIVADALTERAVVTSFALMVDARTDVRQGDRIVEIVTSDPVAEGDGTNNLIIDRGPFRVQEVLTRTGQRAIHHRTLQLERLGGRLDSESERSV